MGVQLEFRNRSPQGLGLGLGAWRHTREVRVGDPPGRPRFAHPVLCVPCRAPDSATGNLRTALRELHVRFVARDGISVKSEAKSTR